MSDALLEQILQLAAPRTDAAEVYFVSSQDTPIEFENNHLKSLQTKAVKGVALRVICNGRLGFASSTDLTRLEDLVDAAVQTAQIGSEADFEFAARNEFAAQNSATDKLDSPQKPQKLQDTPLDTAEFVQIGEYLIRRVHDYNADILVDLGFHAVLRTVRIATSQGLYAERSSQTTSASLSGNLVRGEDFLQAGSYDVGRNEEPDYDLILNQVLQKYRWAEQSASISSGSFPVLFLPRAAASTIGSLFSSVLSGQSVVQKASPLAEKLGETLFDSRLTLFEDPHLGVNACPFDDEGTPTHRKAYIEAGTVQSFYWDRRWAARADKTSTGNGFRGGLSKPSPSLVNVCVAPGQTSTEALIAGMKEGIIVDQVLGAGQSNMLAGEFSVNLDLGYKVEDGKIVGRVKNTMVAGSIFEAFQHLVDLGDVAEWVGGRAYMPSLLFDQLGVAARA
ncbi:MAG: TldD/PmbA family protein [Pegethrix bostrychoides GSE-TBD4-15B]|uniref:TldD/PmbA family protein n=1 Tax=Pegethrix bostrychoides GSE-TBD4-15B TaxID=2839662 RepID=A0A951U6G3_9CYAN|nr:TldD/PmbA family protein [Pegethrix bostrychoides GSE-TBD4-15B]